MILTAIPLVAYNLVFNCIVTIYLKNILKLNISPFVTFVKSFFFEAAACEKQ